MIFDVFIDYNARKNELYVVSPLKSKIRSLFIFICSIFVIRVLLIVNKDYYFSVPIILADIPSDISTEIYDIKVTIACAWCILSLFLAITAWVKFWNSITKKYRKNKWKTVIGLWGLEYSFLLGLQACAANLCVGIVYTTMFGNYSDEIQMIWNCVLEIHSILLIVNEIYSHHRIVILKNGDVTYSKYFKRGVCKKGDICFIFDTSDFMKITIKGERMFSIHILPIKKSEMIDHLKNENLSVIEEV